MTLTRLAAAVLVTATLAGAAEAAPFHVPRATAVAALGLSDGAAVAPSALKAFPIAAVAPFATIGREMVRLFGKVAGPTAGASRVATSETAVVLAI